MYRSSIADCGLPVGQRYARRSSWKVAGSSKSLASILVLRNSKRGICEWYSDWIATFKTATAFAGEPTTRPNCRLIHHDRSQWHAIITLCLR